MIAGAERGLAGSDRGAHDHPIAMASIRLLLVDDHSLIRSALRLLIARFSGIEIVAEASDGQSALEAVAEHRPDLVLMDLSMPGLDGIEAIRRIKKRHVQTRVLVLSMHVAENYVLQALRAGASGYIPKGSSASELEAAIYAVARGDMFLSPSISKTVIDAYLDGIGDSNGPLDQLTPRQREILQLIAEGHSTKEIAHRIGASIKTVESHRATLMERLDIHNIPGLVRYAIRCGLISAEQ